MMAEEKSDDRVTEQEWLLIEDGGGFAIEAVENILKRLALKWTIEKPTMPGWYWHRISPDADAEIVRVNPGSYRTILTGLELLQDNDGEWAGPIAPPI